jgi:hypothetical protein
MEISSKHYGTAKHRWYTKNSWKQRGLVYDDLDELYDVYIKTLQCNHCKKDFKKTRDRCLDHDHENGKFRGIVCQSCNNKDYYINYPKGRDPNDIKKKWVEDNLEKKREQARNWYHRNKLKKTLTH